MKKQRHDGLAERLVAATALGLITRQKQPLDNAFEQALQSHTGLSMEERDIAFARSILMASLRYYLPLQQVLKHFIKKPLPEKTLPASDILVSAAAQLLILECPVHAVIDCAVRLAKAEKRSRPVAGLLNAVLRRVAEKHEGLTAELEAARLPLPDWLWQSWVKTHGRETAREMLRSIRCEPALDLSVKIDAGRWAERLGAKQLPTGSIRLEQPKGRISDMDGFAKGDWWVQDAASALPVLLFGDVAGKTVLDVCAAPGGKTAQLCARGARVTALDVSAKRLKRLKANLNRLGLTADILCQDVLRFKPQQPPDCILLDAPCSATGTIRRHPDIAFIKTPAQIAELAELQARLLDHCADMLASGGELIYCTCSLQPEEGENQIEAFLKRRPDFKRQPVTAEMLCGQSQLINDQGDLSCLPNAVIGESAGLDGFFASRLYRS